MLLVLAFKVPFTSSQDVTPSHYHLRKSSCVPARIVSYFQNLAQCQGVNRPTFQDSLVPALVLYPHEWRLFSIPVVKMDFRMFMPFNPSLPVRGLIAIFLQFFS